MKKIVKNLYALGLIVIISACGGNNVQKPTSFEVRKENFPFAEGYDVQLTYRKMLDSLTLTPIPGQHDAYVLRVGTFNKDSDAFDPSGLILAYDIDRDIRPDHIQLIGVPRGSALEQLANAKRLSEIEKNLLDEVETKEPANQK